MANQQILEMAIPGSIPAGNIFLMYVIFPFNTNASPFKSIILNYISFRNVLNLNVNQNIVDISNS